MKKNTFSEFFPKNYNELTTIQDMANYCAKLAAQYRSGLTKEEKEHLASAILNIVTSSHFQELEKQYPILTNITELSSDLEWSNSLNCEIDWKDKLLKYIVELKRQSKES